MSRVLSVKGDRGRRRGWLQRGSHPEYRPPLRAVVAPKERPHDPLMPWLVRSALNLESSDHLVLHPAASALSVRSLCPFCGSSQDPFGDPCCPEWAVTSGVTLRPVPRADGWALVSRQTAKIVGRLREASHLLVVLIASSTVAMLVSLGMESRHQAEPTVELDTAHLVAVRPSSLSADLLAKGLPPPRPPEPVRDSPQAQPQAATESKSPATAPEASVVQETKPASAQESAPVVVAAVSLPQPETVPPAPREPAPARTGWSAEDLAKWHRLRRGMSRTAVRMIFGYPQWIDRRSTPRTEYWLYTSERVVDGGWIAFFDGEGPVASWREP